MANNSARLAGADMNKFIGYVTTVADVTQKSAESVGESFKTIFSRAGNVKAGKFVASQEDMDSADYSEDEFENLNDIETVLDAVNIKLRENYSTWRSIDDVLEDVGKNWNTWDKTTQNAVATALAGTRQRENVLTLFANWDDVSKYAEIAENAYGTATKKMEAYSDSIDAAKNRLSAALEKIVLDLNNFEVIKDFYNLMTFLVENLKTLIPALLLYIGGTRMDSLASSAGGVIEKIASRFLNSGLVGMTAQGNRQAAAGIIGNFGRNLSENLTQGYLMAQEQAYAQSLSRYTTGLDERTAQNIRALQAELLSIESTNAETTATDKRIIAEQWLAGVYNESAAIEMSASTQKQLASMLYTQASSQEVADILRQVALGGELTETQLQEIEARGGITKLLYEEMQLATQNNNVRKQMAANLSGSISTTNMGVVGTAIGAGAGNLAGMLLGGSIGNQYASAQGWSGSTQVATMLGGSLAGSIAGKGLGGALGSIIGTKSLEGAGAAAMSSLGILGSVPVVGWTALGIALAGLVYAGFSSAAKKKRQEEINKAIEDYNNAVDKYQEGVNTLTIAEKFDELSKGVDNFGRNVSLTDEEYAQFIEYSNKLVEVFPQLLNYVDAEGNSIAYIGDAATTTSDKVKELIKDLQDVKDANLIDSTVFQESLNRAFNKQQEKRDYINQLEKENEDITRKKEDKMADRNHYVRERDKLNVGKDEIEYYTGDNNLRTSLAKNLFNERTIEGFGMPQAVYEQLQEYDARVIRHDIVSTLANNKGDINFVLNKGYSNKDIEETANYLGESLEQFNEKAKNYTNLLSDEMIIQADMVGRTFGEIVNNYDFNAYETYTNKIDRLNKEISKLDSEQTEAFANSKVGIASAKKEIEAYNKELGESAIAYARLNGYFDNMSSDQIGIVSTAITGIRVYDEKMDEEGNVIGYTVKAQEDYKLEIVDVINEIQQLFDENPDFVEIATKATSEGLVGEVEKARDELFSLFQQIFGADGNYSPEEKRIMLWFGFKYDENADIFEDTESRKAKLREALGVDNDSIYDSWNVDSWDIDKFNSVYGMIHSGEVTGRTSTDIIDNLLHSSTIGIASSSKEAMSNMARLIESGKTLEERLDDYYNSIVDGANNSTNAIANEFSDLPENMREAIRQGGDDVKEAASETAEGAIAAVSTAMNNVDNIYKLGLANAFKDVAGNLAKEVFPDIDAGKDGILGEWSEISSMLDQIADSYKTLATAQEEWAASGRLSWETTLDLLTINADYAAMLKVTENGIELVDDAEQIMAQVQVAAAKANVQAKIEELKASNAKIEGENAELEAKINSVETGTPLYIEASNEEIEANADLVDSLNALNKAYAETANQAITTGRAVAEGAKAAKAAENGEVYVPNTSELTYSGFTAKETQAYRELVEWDSAGFDIDAANAQIEANKKVIEKNNHDIEIMEELVNDLDELAESGYSTNKFNSTFRAPSSSNSSGSKTAKEALTNYEKLKELLGAINKEYAQMIVYGDEANRNFIANAEQMQEKYYGIKEELLLRSIDELQSLLGGRSLQDIYAITDDDTFKKYIGYYKELQDLQVQLNNLDDEEIQDRIKILELQNADKKVIVEQYKTLVKTADTLEECLEYQKQLYEAMRDEVNTRLQIAEAQEKSAKDTLGMYEELSALSGQRLVSSQYAHDYVTNPDATGNAWLDRQREALNENSQEWMELAELLKNPELSDEEREQYKERQDLLHETNALIREAMGYDGGADGGGYNDLTNGDKNGTQKNQLEHEQDLQKEREQRRQIIENIINKFEKQNVSYELINQQLYQLLDLAQNEEQKLDIFERIEENQRKQYDLIKGIKEFQVTKNNFELEYLNPYLNEERYSYLKEQNKQMYKEIQANAKAEYSRLWNQIYNDNIAAGATPEQASQMAYGNSDVQAALQDYMDAYKAYGDVIMSVIEDKLEHIQWHIDKLEKEKPQEWASIKQIEKFEKNEIALYQQKLDVLWEQLQDIKDITDDQIKYMVDEYNDAFKAIHDMRIQALSDKLSYQDNILEAIRFAVDTQVKDLELQRDIIEKIYDDELKKLQDKNESIERTNKLIELQNKLLDANKEKERVYRQGIGWVYETDRNKVKTAQQNIDAFNRQDRINDIEESKENDLKRIAEEIDGWQDYLEALEWQYEQWQHEENMRLLKETLGVDTDQEVYDLLREDMHAYREYRQKAIDGNQMFADIKTGITGKIESLGQNFDWLGNRVVVLGEEVDGVIKYFTYTIDEANKLFGLAINEWMESGKPFWQWLMEGFDGVFQHFLDEHYNNEKEYHDLMREELDLLDIDDFLIGNELPEGWDNPNYTPAAVIKKKEYKTLWDIVLSDKDFVNARRDNGEDVSDVMSGDQFIDYSAAMYRAIKDQDWEALNYYAVLRNVKSENLGYDISGNTEGFRSNEQVAVDAYKQYYKDIDEEVTKGFIDTQRELIRAANNNNSNYKQIETFLDNAISKEINTVKTSSGQEIGVQKTSTGELKAVLYDGNGQIKTQLTKSEQEMVNNYTEQANLSRTLLDLNTVRTLKGIDELGEATIAEQISQGLKYTLALDESTGKLELQMIDNNGQVIKQISEENASILGFKNTTATNLNTIQTQQANSEKVLRISQENDIKYNSEMSHLINAVGSLIDTDLKDEVAANVVSMVTALGEQYGLLKDVSDESSDQNDWLAKMRGDTQSLQEAVLEILAENGASQATLERVEQNGILYTMQNAGFDIDDVSDLKGISTSGLSDSTLRKYSSVIQEINKLSEQWWATDDPNERASLAAQALAKGQAAGLTRTQGGAWVDSTTTYSVAAAHAKSTVVDSSSGKTYTSTYSDSSGSYTGSSKSAYDYIRDSNSHGNDQLDNVKSTVQSATDRWWAADAAEKNGSMTKEQAAAEKAQAHADAEAARGSVGYSGGADGSKYIATRANGIEGGPITYTGLAMLHGSPSSPEYVLNSDQAYNVLKYIASGKRPTDNIESYNNNTNKTTQYIVEGDIILENCDNPAEFWDEVTTAMGNRWNVTKNR